ncbi:hypothetical protein LXL04_021883 [Taraxacum kok-saghyz]
MEVLVRWFRDGDGGACKGNTAIWKNLSRMCAFHSQGAINRRNQWAINRRVLYGKLHSKMAIRSTFLARQPPTNSVFGVKMREASYIPIEDDNNHNPKASLIDHQQCKSDKETTAENGRGGRGGGESPASWQSCASEEDEYIV